MSKRSGRVMRGRRTCMVRSRVDRIRKGFFFFKQKTAYEMCGRDWSSDVCSSDMKGKKEKEGERGWEETNDDGWKGGERKRDK